MATPVSNTELVSLKIPTQKNIFVQLDSVSPATPFDSEQELKFQSPSTNKSIDVTRSKHSLYSISDASIDSQSTVKNNKDDSMTYWISINSILGCVFFTSGSIFWLNGENLSGRDNYALITVAYFVGCITFGLASYLSYYEVINKPDNVKVGKSFCLYSGKKGKEFWIAFCYFCGMILYVIATGVAVLGYWFEVWSIQWWLLSQGPVFIGGLFFALGGFLGLLQRYTDKLSRIISVLSCLGGIMFFVAGIGQFFSDPLIVFWMVKIPYTIGSVSYLISSTLGLWQWHSGYDGNEFHQCCDVVFSVLYTITVAVGITGIVYAVLCERFIDWIKGFVLAVLVGIVVLMFGSKKRPHGGRYQYIKRCSRIFMIIFTMNQIIDAYHISGQECEAYGSDNR